MTGTTRGLGADCRFLWFPKVFPHAFDPERWTVGKYIVFTFWQLVVIGIFASVLIHIAGFHPQLSLWKNMYYYFINQATYGGISIVLLTFVIRDVMLKTSLRNALHANQELERIRHAYNIREVVDTRDMVTIQSDTSESIDLCPNDLLYVVADDNYSTLYWKNGSITGKKMLRINLKSIETQLNNSHVIRCHRSYLVNISAITHVSGNANGYKLSVRDTDFTVPVSRSKGKEVIEQIENVRSLAEACK